MSATDSFNPSFPSKKVAVEPAEVLAGDRGRCEQAGVPNDVALATRSELADDMITAAIAAGVDGGKTRCRAEHLATELPATAWTRRSAGDGSKGPRFYDWAWLADVGADGDPDDEGRHSLAVLAICAADNRTADRLTGRHRFSRYAFTELRCCPRRATAIVQAILVLLVVVAIMTHHEAGGAQRGDGTEQDAENSADGACTDGRGDRVDGDTQTQQHPKRQTDAAISGRNFIDHSTTLEEWKAGDDPATATTLVQPAVLLVRRPCLKIFVESRGFDMRWCPGVQIPTVRIRGRRPSISTGPARGPIRIDVEFPCGL